MLKFNLLIQLTQLIGKSTLLWINEDQLEPLD